MAKEKAERSVTKQALRVLQLDSISTDSSYQREVKPGHKKIQRDFDENALGIPVVGERSDGTFWIVDGLQRITALRGMGKTTVRAEVFASRGPEHEAEVFKKINLNRTKLSSYEEYRALLTAHDEEAWAIKDAVEKCGFKITSGRHKSSTFSAANSYVTSVNTLFYIYRTHGTDAITFALTCAKDCWPGDPLGVYHTLTKGLASFWAGNDGVIDLDRLYPRLRSVTPQKIIYSAAQLINTGKDSSSGSTVAQVLMQLYKKRLGGKKTG